MRYRAIMAGPAELSVGRRCALLVVSRSGFYAWCHRPASCREAEDAILVEAIREIHAGTGRTYGSPRMPASWPAVACGVGDTAPRG